MKTRVDSKGRVVIPKELRKRLGLGRNAVIRWMSLGDRLLGLLPEDDTRSAAEEVLSYLENLSNNEVPRKGRPDYREVSKAELWLAAVD